MGITPIRPCQASSTIHPQPIRRGIPAVRQRRGVGLRSARRYTFARKLRDTVDGEYPRWPRMAAVRLHVHEWGDSPSPPLVCVHGVTGHGERFKRLAELRWAETHHVVAPDLRGHGRSGYDEPWDFATHIADLVETTGALGIERADWVGHSFGGRLVLELAARHPERIRRAVLLDPAIQILPHVAEFVAEAERTNDVTYAAGDEYLEPPGAS